MKTRDQGDAEPNHDPAHHQRAKNTPDEDAMLRDGGNAEVGEDQNKNENVIDAERVFDEVTGQKIERSVRAAQFPDEQIEKKRKHYPDGAALRGGTHAQGAVAQLELNKIGKNRKEDADMKCDPKPNARRHRCTVSCHEPCGNRKEQGAFEFFLAIQTVHRNLCDP